jgi:beta-lactamase regulating signal transducer with metallopeptidase domain
MTAVLHAMLGNAAVAAVLALLALVVGRTCRSAAVRHIAWVLVLLKLVTPPLFSVPLPVLPASWAAMPAEPALPTGSILQPRSSTPATQNSPVKGVVRAPVWWGRSWAEGLVQGALAVWVAGAAGWFVWQGRRIIRFRRRIARAVDAGPEVAAVVCRLAATLGIDRPPAVMAAAGIGSPMLWGWGRGTVILFPRELLARLAPEARDTLLAHELAHFLRRDHWVRVLEFVATGLYWWHPAVWLARGGIEAAEEECCDAWVVGGLAASPRRYAEALLATVDFTAELQRPCLPPGACAANRGAQLLHRRLIGIIHAERPTRLHGAVRAAVLAVLLTQPVLVAATQESGIRSPEAEVRGEESGVRSPKGRVRRQGGYPGSRPLVPPKSAEPRAWATAPAPGGAVTAVARDHEVVLRRQDGTVTALGPGKPVALAFAPDGKQLATAGPGTLVRTWDDRGGLLAQAHVPAAAWAIAYAPDGTCILVLDAVGGISVCDPYTLALRTSWTVEGPANSLAFSPDGRCVAVAFGSWLDAESGWVECWSIRERRPLATYEASAPVGATRFSPDGSLLVIGGWNGLLAWRTLPRGELIAERKLSKDLVAAAAFSPDAGTLPLDPPPEPPPPETPPESATPKAPAMLQGVSQLPQP